MNENKVYEIIAYTADSSAFGEDFSQRDSERWAGGGNSWKAVVAVYPERREALAWVSPSGSLMINHAALTVLMGRNAQYERPDAKLNGTRWYHLGEQMNETLMQSIRDNIGYPRRNKRELIVQQRGTEIFNWLMGLVGEVGIKVKEVGK